MAAANLKSGNTASCGCLKVSTAPDHDLTGQRFGRLVALSPLRVQTANGRWAWFWMCQCDCGVSKKVRAETLRNGATTSCGCRAASVTSARNRTHGLANTRANRIWKGMLTRCNTPSATSYERYGGRGIRVCDRWRSFDNFHADMGDPPSDKHSIDRIDNDGNYEKSNCKWATNQEQTRHTRRNHMVEIAGENLPLVIWCERYGASYYLVKDRLRWGWDPLRALTEPARAMRKPTKG